MQDGIPTPDEASEWLKKHFSDDSAPEIDITFMVRESSPLIYQEVMEILFGPPMA